MANGRPPWAAGGGGGGSPPRGGTVGSDRTKPDWYCCKDGCRNNKGERWWNPGSANRCSKCKLHKGACFGSNRYAEGGATSVRAASVAETRAEAKYKKLYEDKLAAFVKQQRMLMERPALVAKLRDKRRR